MFTIVTEKSKFFRIKRGQSGEEVEKFFLTPVGGAAFAGRIIEVKRNLSVHIAAVGDTYRTIAAATGCKEAALRELNGAKPVYPTCKIFYPRKNN